MKTSRVFVVVLALVSAATAQLPKPIEGGYALPNGWRLTPVGRHVVLPDYVLNV